MWEEAGALVASAFCSAGAADRPALSRLWQGGVDKIANLEDAGSALSAILVGHPGLAPGPRFFKLPKVVGPGDLQGSGLPDQGPGGRRA
ncbi:hypothetical protein SLG_07100 [Sphingobium sp. SYK-6]|nr:hypothetical protein SLG_07100 [Sphingobium sp. SYK-6]